MSNNKKKNENKSSSIRELDCLQPFNLSPENTFFSESRQQREYKSASENSSSDDESSHETNYIARPSRSGRKRKESGGAYVPESQPGSPSKSPATSPERPIVQPDVSTKLTLETNGVLKYQQVLKLQVNKTNFMQFQNGMFLVFKNTRVSGKNLLEICFLGDPDARVKVANLTKEQRRVYDFANECAIMIIARCVDVRLHMNFQKEIHAYKFWNSLKPTRSLIAAAKAVREIENLKREEFDNNVTYYDEMILLYNKLLLEQDKTILHERRFILVLIEGLQSIDENESLTMNHLFPLFNEDLLTVDKFRNVLEEYQFQLSTKSDRQKATPYRANQAVRKQKKTKKWTSQLTPLQEQLKKEGKCFVCHVQGHMRGDPKCSGTPPHVANLSGRLSTFSFSAHSTLNISQPMIVNEHVSMQHEDEGNDADDDADDDNDDAEGEGSTPLQGWPTEGEEDLEEGQISPKLLQVEAIKKAMDSWPTSLKEAFLKDVCPKCSHERITDALEVSRVNCWCSFHTTSHSVSNCVNSMPIANDVIDVDVPGLISSSESDGDNEDGPPAVLTAADLFMPSQPLVVLPHVPICGTFERAFRIWKSEVPIDLPGLDSGSSDDSCTTCSDDESDTLPNLLDHHGDVYSYIFVDEQTTPATVNEEEQPIEQPVIEPIAQLSTSLSSTDPDGWDTLTITRTTSFSSMTRGAVQDYFVKIQGAILREFHSELLLTNNVRESPAHQVLQLTIDQLMDATQRLEEAPEEQVSEMEDLVMRVGEVKIFGAARTARLQMR
jgi:hypothetical protein